MTVNEYLSMIFWDSILDKVNVNVEVKQLTGISIFVSVSYYNVLLSQYGSQVTEHN